MTTAYLNNFILTIFANDGDYESLWEDYIGKGFKSIFETGLTFTEAYLLVKKNLKSLNVVPNFQFATAELIVDGYKPQSVLIPNDLIHFKEKTMEKKPKIKFRLYKASDNKLEFLLLEMDPRFSIEADSRTWFMAKNGLCIFPSIEPGFISGPFLKNNINELRLRGYKHDIFAIPIEHKELVIDGLKDWAENWEGFKGELSPTESDCQQDIYEF